VRGRIVAMVMSVAMAMEPLAAQAAPRAWVPQSTVAEPIPQPVRSATLVRPERAPSRGGYMFLGGSAGGLLGALYAGARLGSGDAEARRKVLVPPVIGIALGAAAGAIWFEVTHTRR
jgi:hypothetical protein